MKTLLKTVAAAVIVLSAGQTSALEHRHPEIAKLPEPLQALRDYAGTWQGTHKDADGRIENVPLTYEPSAGGSVMLEKIFAGTDKEMLSVYHADRDKVIMTHYCLLNNQPELKLTKHEGNSYWFEFTRGGNMKSKGDAHMHEMKLTLVDHDHFTQEWSLFEKGKKVHSDLFTYVRQK